MSKKEQTAVSWLMDCIPVELLKDDYIQSVFEIAKQKEKQQIINACNFVNRQDFYDGTEEVGINYYKKNF